MRILIFALSVLLSGFTALSAVADEPLRVASFRAEATPPLGSPLCNGNVKPAMEIVSPLTARGVVLLGAGDPIVLCAFDWVGIGNGSYDEFRKAIAEAVGTTPDRVALHTLHQHDAPGSDFATEKLLAEYGLGRLFSNRPLLARRLAEGMKLAWQSQKKSPIRASDIDWSIVRASLPVRDTLVEDKLLAKLRDEDKPTKERLRAARDLTFVRRMNNGHRIPLTCLKLGTARILHMPGELFVEYQIAAQNMRPHLFVAMAAYGDYGPGYIGTEIAYGQGGYETGRVSRVAPRVEHVLMEAMKHLLELTP